MAAGLAEPKDFQDALTAFFSFRGGEHWHPNIDPFYAKGAGPMLDIGCYLVNTARSLIFSTALPPPVTRP